MAGAPPDRFARLQRIAVPYGLGAVLMGAANVVIFQVLRGQYPDVSPAYLEVCVSPLFAAVQEPFTSKLIPAILLVAWTTRADQSAWLRRDWRRVAVASGLVVGLVELGSNVVGGSAPGLELLPRVALHVATALLVGWAVFRTAGRRKTLIDLHVVVLALGLAVLLHVGWNRYLFPVLAGPLPC